MNRKLFPLNCPLNLAHGRLVETKICLSELKMAVQSMSIWIFVQVLRFVMVLPLFFQSSSSFLVNS